MSKDKFENMMDFIKKSSEVLFKTKGKILLVSHYDADGISSSALLQKTLLLIKRSFDSTFVKILDVEFLERVGERDYDVVIFSDIGSGHVIEIDRILKDKVVYILDHHGIQQMPFRKNVFLINPIVFGFESKDVSGAGVSYLFAKSLSSRIKEYSYLAVVGGFADNQINGDEMGFLNSILMEEALLTNKIEKSKGLKIFGRFTRPLYKALEYTNEPYLPNITGNTSGAIQFLNSLGIEIRKGNTYRIYDDLSDVEKEKLLVSLLLEINKEDMNKLVGDVFKVNGKYEIREFITLLNACGRMEKPQEGVKLCMDVPNKANEIYENYRKELSYAMKKVKSGNFKEYGLFKVFELDKSINPNFTGTLLSMIIKSESSNRVLISMSEEGDYVKVSSRTRNKNCDLHKLMSSVCSELGGYGGGHKYAAGGKFPIIKKDDFFKYLRNYREKG